MGIITYRPRLSKSLESDLNQIMEFLGRKSLIDLELCFKLIISLMIYRYQIVFMSGNGFVFE